MAEIVQEDFCCFFNHPGYIHRMKREHIVHADIDNLER